MRCLPYPTNPTPRACRDCDYLTDKFYCTRYGEDVRIVRKVAFVNGMCYGRVVNGLLAATDNKYGCSEPTVIKETTE